MIIGHLKEQEILRKIINEYERGSFMLLGPEGVGKFYTLKTILEENKKNDEIIIFDTKDKILKLDTSNFIQNLLTISTKTRRFIVVNDAHKLNKESQNALLKIIEEIKTSAILFFVSHRPFKILPTIRSRMQKIFFRLVPNDEIRKFLEKEDVKKDYIDFLLDIFTGKIGKIIKVLADKEKFNLISKIYFSNDSYERLLIFYKSEDKIDLEEFLNYFIFFERKNLLKGDKTSIWKIKYLEGLYEDSDYFLNKGLQINNILLNLYG